MSAAQNQKRNQVKLARLEIVAKLYKRGYSIRKIRDEVMRRLDLPTYSLQTVHKDVRTLLDEWRESRLDDLDDALELELQRIDDTVRELWEQWEKSKTDYSKTESKQKGSPSRDKDTGQTTIRTFQTERKETEVVSLGNPAYISEIRQQLAERRKLLGLYAPEKKDVQGGISFASFLMESGALDDAERSINENTLV
jgi:hypothetical protein|nr:hypothetical protein [Bacteroides intestinalis]